MFTGCEEFAGDERRDGGPSTSFSAQPTPRRARFRTARRRPRARQSLVCAKMVFFDVEMDEAPALGEEATELLYLRLHRRARAPSSSDEDNSPRPSSRKKRHVGDSGDSADGSDGSDSNSPARAPSSRDKDDSPRPLSRRKNQHAGGAGGPGDSDGSDSSDDSDSSNDEMMVPSYEDQDADDEQEQEGEEDQEEEEEEEQAAVGPPTKEEASALIRKRRPIGKPFGAKRHRQLDVLRAIAAPLQSKSCHGFRSLPAWMRSPANTVIGGSVCPRAPMLSKLPKASTTTRSRIRGSVQPLTFIIISKRSLPSTFQ